jgi:CheY-like chemotaxis protein
MGGGTGLGLASAYGIIKNHGGFSTADSKPGIGSTFSIHLPAADKRSEYEETTMDKLISGTETLMLVDDEQVVLDVGRAMLAKLGYQVLTATSGTAAVELYRAKQDAIALVILDMIMPGMSGSQTFDALKAINPDIRVLLSSGYSIDGEATTILENGCRGFIQKPFGLEQLACKVREVLE